MRPRRAVVTGASAGIGRALAIELARGGVDEIVIVARHAGPLQEAAREIEAAGARTLTLARDVADVDGLVRELRSLDDEAPIDLVVANAAVGAAGDAHLAWETYRDALSVNFLGAAATLGALADRMAARRRGHLVATSSLSSFGALPRSIAYSVPKAGLNMLMDCLRLDLAPHGVAVTNVYLGFVDTRMVARSKHPMPQLLTPIVAARAMARAIAQRRDEVVLPRALGLSVRALAAIPKSLRDRLYRAVDRVAG